MLSLALRFIPLLFDKFEEIREAQRARGLERSVVALLMPLLIKTLRMANDLTEAIEARGYDPDR
jgi:biotin transport system permease protein